MGRPSRSTAARLVATAAIIAAAATDDDVVVYVPCSESDVYPEWFTLARDSPRPSSIPRTAPTLRGCSRLILSGAELSSVDALRLTHAISSGGDACNSTTPCVRQLQEISLEGVPVGDAGAAVLGDTLAAVLPFNISLNMGSSSISSLGAASLAAALRFPASPITSFAAEWNDALGDLGASAIGSALQVNRALTSLGLERCGIGDEGISHIATALRINAQLPLRDLRLEGNLIRAAGARALGEAMAEGISRLESLGLALNPLGAEGALALAGGIRHNRVLYTLNLAGCGIGDDGAIAIAIALRSNQALRSLSLDSNDIGPRGAAALASMLRINPALRTLSLRHNKIGPKNAARLHDAVSGGEVAAMGAGGVEELRLEYNMVRVGLMDVYGAPLSDPDALLE